MDRAIARALGRINRREARREGELHVVLSGRARERESLFVVNPAVILARRYDGGSGVLLLDCALPTNIAGVALGLDPNYSLREAAYDLPRRDRIVLTSTVARHAESGLCVPPLSLDNGPAQDLSATSVSSLLFIPRGLVHSVVMNVGTFRRSGIANQLVRSATGSFLYTTRALTDVQSTHLLLKHSGLGKADRDRRNLLGDNEADIDLSDKQISETVDLHTAIRLPAGHAAPINSLNAGRPLAIAQPRSPYTRAISRSLVLVRRHDGPALESSIRTGRIRRLFPRVD